MAQDGSAQAQATPRWRSPGFKFLLIVLLTIAMAAPLFFIQLALSDREQTASGAATDIATGWGGAQVVAGPILFVPYTVTTQNVVDGHSQPTFQQYTAVLLPETLDIDTQAEASMRSRGIFEVPVYRAAITMRATFDKQAMASLAPKGATVQWDRARVAIRVSDSHGLADNVTLHVNASSIAFSPGVDTGSDTRLSGIQAPLSLSGPADLSLDTSFTLRGSREFSVAPLGRRTQATIRSTWASPSFFGAFLPVERTVGKDGFKSSWVVPWLARGFGQSFEDSPNVMDLLVQPAFGVKFYQPVDHYQLVQRSLKYSVLFVALAFLIFFVVETVSPQRLHAVQYALVGAAQVLFYLLLLSFSEHIGFGPAYLAAATATVGATSLYAVSALASQARAGVLCAVLSAIYGLLYVILNAEDYALLIGSGLLFAALAATMYVTRNINWHALTRAP
ncbi:MAG TPA: cell envelope integrity protein CreD [Rhizomicrobium sp.]|nr:cell envelope integrity protein CreD [Rhizomicrobium sp.]